MSATASSKLTTIVISEPRSTVRCGESKCGGHPTENRNSLRSKMIVDVTRVEPIFARFVRRDTDLVDYSTHGDRTGRIGKPCTVSLACHSHAARVPVLLVIIAHIPFFWTTCRDGRRYL